MSVFPIYQDALTYNMFGKDDLPFYILMSRLWRKYPLHYHNFAELSLVIEGSAEEILNGRPHALRRGTVSLLLPHHMHEIRVEPGTAITKYCCMFDLNILSPDEDHIGTYLLKTGSELPSYYDLSEVQTQQLSKIMDDLFLEYHSKGFGKNTVIRHKLLEALVFLIRTYQDLRDTKIPLNDERKRGVFDMLQFIHIHCCEPLTLTMLSEHLGWNASYLSHIFKRHVGKSFIEYLHELRVGRAVSYLVSTQLSVSEIALEVGFDNFRTFSRVFKDLKGTTPKEFRSHYRQGLN
ncbi:helix-turn-helix transcriptional regulator [Paenibacillus nasutitermitis]|uniref:HTH araC/xylS-type domain-containing protein n=1 Tax=Paenibacillus nasutitermitis TaxID=1652958 RepID=A0A916YT19_9BACL|nr:AraC family transcriptional regulator [Paenibacillus nasutitermitis]GGD59125.1 hypothetical protein GCM10010911_16160 [Paenibacillus nasutitermitis]